MAKLYNTDGTILEVEPKNGTDFSLEEIQDFVGDYFEVVSLKGSNIMVINGEGRVKRGLPFNALATDVDNKSYGLMDYIAGNALVCKSNQIK